MTDKIVVLTAAASEADAAALARNLIDKRLAACVNLIPGVKSVYWWRGAVEESQEYVLLIKSRRDLFDKLRAELIRTHSYDVPEVLALPVVDGAAPYLEWIDRSVIPA